MRAPIKKDLTQEYLKSILHYEPETGIFTWSSPRPKIRVGDRAGSSNKHIYRYVWIDGGPYKEHRLAWLYMTGDWPEHEIDHRNGVKDDNRWTNLRKATREENTQNAAVRKDNSTGVKGVHWSERDGAYVVQLQTNKVRRVLGKFASLDEAEKVITKARAAQHKEFARRS